MDFFRQEKHAHALEPLHAISADRICQTHPSPSQALERAELRDALRHAIAQLTPIRRRVFVLYYHDLSIKAIARLQNRSEGTIKNHLRNARIQLQEHLTPYLKNENI